MKISYQWGNLAPIAKAAVTPNAGREPLAVTLSATGSKDYENDPMHHEWRLHPGGKLLAATATARVDIAQQGNYVVELIVRDDQDAAGQAPSTTAIRCASVH